MKRLVVDAPVIASWFEPDGHGRQLRTDYEAGMLAVVGPRHLPQDILELLARTASRDADRLSRIGTELRRLGFELHDPPIAELAKWVTRMPAQRAAYLALATHLDLALATHDPALLAASPAAWPPDRC